MKSLITKLMAIIVAIVGLAICIRYFKSDSLTAEITSPLNPATPELVPIEIKLPKPMFTDTPQNITVPNLEKPLGRPRPPFLAPIGTTNVALGKPVFSTDEEPFITRVSAGKFLVRGEITITNLNT